MATAVVLGLDTHEASAVQFTEPDPAVALAERVVAAMGGREQFDRMRYLRFDFAIDLEGPQPFQFQSRHLWDRWEGDYRVEWRFGDGPLVVALINVQTGEGDVFLDGRPAPEDQRERLLGLARYRFANETYWLLMPWKWRDPGVRLDYVGPRQREGKQLEVVHLAFENVGVTPGDQYWAFVDPVTGRLDRFRYYLESFAGEPRYDGASEWIWRDWQEIDGVLFARERVLVQAPVEGYTRGRVRFPLIDVLSEVDRSWFTSAVTRLPAGP